MSNVLFFCASVATLRLFLRCSALIQSSCAIRGRHWLDLMLGVVFACTLVQPLTQATPRAVEEATGGPEKSFD